MPCKIFFKDINYWDNIFENIYTQGKKTGKKCSNNQFINSVLKINVLGYIPENKSVKKIHLWLTDWESDVREGQHVFRGTGLFENVSTKSATLKEYIYN